MKRGSAEAKALKRRWARITLLLWVLGAGLMAMSPFLIWLWLEMESDWAAVHEHLRPICLGLGAVCLCLGVLCQRRKLRCPICGKGVSFPKWSYWQETRYCSRCGKPYVYDDES